MKSRRKAVRGNCSLLLISREGLLHAAGTMGHCTISKPRSPNGISFCVGGRGSTRDFGNSTLSLSARPLFDALIRIFYFSFFIFHCSFFISTATGREAAFTVFANWQYAWAQNMAVLQSGFREGEGVRCGLVAPAVQSDGTPLEGLRVKPVIRGGGTYTKCCLEL